MLSLHKINDRVMKRIALLDIKSCPTKGYESAHTAPQPLLSISRYNYSITVLTH